MKRDIILKLAASTMVISTTLTGCGPFAGGSVASMSSKPASAKDGPRYAKKAEKALRKGQVEKAVAYAEHSVAGVGYDADSRALLGQAYMAAGRFSAAERSFMDAMELGKTDARTILSLSMAQLAQGKADKAKRLVETNRQHLPAADYGLALALSGDSKKAVDVLSDAIRDANATGRTRQNLGLAYALDGRWRDAKLMALQDVAPASLNARILEWAQMARPGAYQTRVATLLNVTPDANDPGQPVRLALNAAPEVVAAAKSSPSQDYRAEVVSFDRNKPLPAVGPAPKADSDVDFVALEKNVKVSKIEKVELPASKPKAVEAKPVESKPVAKKKPAAAPLIKAATKPARVAPQKTVIAKKAPSPATKKPKAKPVKTAASQTLAAAKPILRKIAFTNSTKSALRGSHSGTHMVQLGVFSSAENAKRAWGIYSKKHNDLGVFGHSMSKVKVKGKMLYRLAATGFGNKAAANAMCVGIKAGGSNCIVRQRKATTPIRMAAKKPVRIASR